MNDDWNLSNPNRLFLLLIVIIIHLWTIEPSWQIVLFYVEQIRYHWIEFCVLLAWYYLASCIDVYDNANDVFMRLIFSSHNFSFAAMFSEVSITYAFQRWHHPYINMVHSWQNRPWVWKFVSLPNENSKEVTSRVHHAMKCTLVWATPFIIALQ